MQRESEKSHTKTKSYFQIFVKLGECREGREGDEREVGVEGGKKEMVERKKKRKERKLVPWSMECRKPNTKLTFYALYCRTDFY